MRIRITVRQTDDPKLEIRGYMDGDINSLGAFAEAMEPFGLVMASPVEDDYDPFA